jgi:four helix bundle protein
MPYQSFKQLKVWQEARDLAVDIYKIAGEGKLSRDFALKDQILRSGVSISSNIAEGCDRATPREFSRFLDIARGSTAELRTQIDIATAIGHIDKKTFEALDDRCQKISAMITNLKKRLTSNVPRQTFL